MKDPSDAKSSDEERSARTSGSTAIHSETSRLEQLWGGNFGDEYTERNIGGGRLPYEGRVPFWRAFLTKYGINNVLEVGCNIGANLKCINQIAPDCALYGVDINKRALTILVQNLPQASTAMAAARVLPFREGRFDVVFTAGVLIHQPNASLQAVMKDIVRCSRRYVLCAEYYAEKETEVFYRNQRNVLIKRDFGKLYLDSFSELELLETGFLAKEKDGWDDVTYWIFQKGIANAEAE